MGNIKLARAYFYSKNDKKGIYPVEQKHTILKDTCFPEVKEMICYTACLEPYAKSQEVLEKLSNIKISASEIQKITKEIGSQLVSDEDYLIEVPVKYTSPKKKIDKMAISMDGAMVNTIEGWKEVKSGVIYEFKESSDKIKSCKKSYVSRIENCDDFRKRIKEEARRRNYIDVNELITIGDGAKWIWDLVEKEFPFSTQIVDWYHAKHHLFNIVKLIFGDKVNDEVKFLTEEMTSFLYNGNIQGIKEAVHKKIIEYNLIEDTARLTNIHTEVNYFIKNEKRMKYSIFKSKGYPIGSGIIEATCKQLVQLRLKRNGMKWKKEGAHCILQLRCHHLGNRWDEVKNAIYRKVA